VLSQDESVRFELWMHVMRYFWVVYGFLCANVGGATSSEGFLVLCTPSMFGTVGLVSGRASSRL